MDGGLPAAFRPEVQTSCKLEQVEPDLFQALIREESALDPHVISWAGAVGLSQCSYACSTAKSVAKELHVKQKIDVESLQQPELNLRPRLAPYVGMLLKRFSRESGAGAGGLQRRPGRGGRLVARPRGTRGPRRIFVEEIPIAEERVGM